MNSDPLDQSLREVAWRRPLTPAEQAQLAAWLAQHPDSRADWAADSALSAALAHLPGQPAPSNLVARVLAEIDRDAAAAARPQPARGWRWLATFGWAPRTAVVAVVLAAGFFAYHQHQQATHSRTVRALAEAAHDLPSPEVLQDLDVIVRLTPDSAADVDLLALDLK
jgi:hypothetical protein